MHKFYISVVDVQNSLIANGDPMSVLSKIFDHVFGLAKRGFTMHVPWFYPNIVHQRFIGLPQRFLNQFLLDHLHQLSTKHRAQLGYRIQVFATFANALEVARQGEARCRNDTMHMRMQTEILPPSMQHTHGRAGR